MECRDKGGNLGDSSLNDYSSLSNGAYWYGWRRWLLKQNPTGTYTATKRTIPVPKPICQPHTEHHTLTGGGLSLRHRSRIGIFYFFHLIISFVQEWPLGRIKMLVRAVESTMVSYSVPTCSVQKCCKEFVQRVTKFKLPVNQQKYRFTQMKNFLFKKLLFECLFWGVVVGTTQTTIAGTTTTRTLEDLTSVTYNTGSDIRTTIKGSATRVF